jgi:hypothetical protein
MQVGDRCFIHEMSQQLLLLAAPLLLDQWQGSAWPYDGM